MVDAAGTVLGCGCEHARRVTLIGGCDEVSSVRNKLRTDETSAGAYGRPLHPESRGLSPQV